MDLCGGRPLGALDVFLPVLPSGVLVITAATRPPPARPRSRARRPRAGPRQVPRSCPDALRGDRLRARRPRRLPAGLARRRPPGPRHRPLPPPDHGAGTSRHGPGRGGGALVVIARFAPAGRSVVSLGAGAAHRKVTEFLPWSALAGLAWAGYSVGLGYFGGQWLGATWLGTAVSVLGPVRGGRAGGVPRCAAPPTATVTERHGWRPGRHCGRLPDAPGRQRPAPPGRPAARRSPRRSRPRPGRRPRWLCAAGARKPDTLRTYCRAAARISSSVASSGRTGGRRVLMLRHMPPVCDAPLTTPARREPPRPAPLDQRNMNCRRAPPGPAGGAEHGPEVPVSGAGSQFAAAAGSAAVRCGQ